MSKDITFYCSWSLSTNLIFPMCSTLYSYHNNNNQALFIPYITSRMFPVLALWLI